MCFVVVVVVVVVSRLNEGRGCSCAGWLEKRKLHNQPRTEQRLVFFATTKKNARLFSLVHAVGVALL